MIHPEPVKRPIRKKFSPGNSPGWGVLSLLLVGVFALLYGTDAIVSSPVSKGVSTAGSRIGRIGHFAVQGFHPLNPAPAMEPFLIIFLHTADGAVPLESGDRVFEGDRVQIQYRTPKGFGTIFSVDGRGTVTLHFPDRASFATHLDSGQHLLPFAFQLDDAPGFEIFFFATADSPLPMDRILRAARTVHGVGDSIDVADSGIQIRKVVLHKQVRSQ